MQTGGGSVKRRGSGLKGVALSAIPCTTSSEIQTGGGGSCLLVEWRPLGRVDIWRCRALPAWLSSFRRRPESRKSVGQEENQRQTHLDSGLRRNDDEMSTGPSVAAVIRNVTLAESSSTTSSKCNLAAVTIAGVIVVIGALLPHYLGALDGGYYGAALVLEGGFPDDMHHCAGAPGFGIDILEVGGGG